MNEKELIRLYRIFYILGDSPSLKILFELERYGEKNFTELKQNLSINPATLSKKLKLLSQVGLVSSDKSHDHLRVYYSLHNYKKSVRKILDSLEKLSNEL